MGAVAEAQAPRRHAFGDRRNGSNASASSPNDRGVSVGRRRRHTSIRRTDSPVDRARLAAPPGSPGASASTRARTADAAPSSSTSRGPVVGMRREPFEACGASRGRAAPPSSATRPTGSRRSRAALSASGNSQIVLIAAAAWSARRGEPINVTRRRRHQRRPAERNDGRKNSLSNSPVHRHRRRSIGRLVARRREPPSRPGPAGPSARRSDRNSSACARTSTPATSTDSVIIVRRASGSRSPCPARDRRRQHGIHDRRDSFLLVPGERVASEQSVLEPAAGEVGAAVEVHDHARHQVFARRRTAPDAARGDAERLPGVCERR